jgi:hypothetical protein
MIIKYTKQDDIRAAYMNIYPDQFVSDKKKKGNEWIKQNLDYFANVAYSQYTKNRDKFVKNYNLVKGILTPEDFYEQTKKEDVRSFVDLMVEDLELPSYVKHYSILNPPLNTMIGEMSNRPNTRFVKAFDDDSKSEEAEYKTSMVEGLIMQMATKKINAQLAEKGIEVEEEEKQQLTMEEVEENLANYSTLAESWANHMLKALDAYFNIKEKSEDAFRDLLISSREFFHIYEDNSKVGFSIEVINPANFWHLSTPNKKYIHKEHGSYAVGTVHVMELSEIIDKFDLDKDEIDHLRNNLNNFNLLNVRESNLTNPQVGIAGVKYDVYDPVILQERALAESRLNEGHEELSNWLGINGGAAAHSLKYAVVQAYWITKKKVGNVFYQDEMGEIQSMLVDENYKLGDHPGEIDIIWGWINQWYKGFRIGSDIFRCEPFKLLPYCPIIGVIHDIKNGEPRSFIDLLKPFQTLYNVTMNQLFKLLEKDMGVVQLMSIRHIAVPKDGDAQDALEMWEEEARRRGIMFIDDSPENVKGPSTFNQYARLDLSRHNEIQARYNLAAQLKNEAWELVGISRQRTGSVLATETATGTNTALAQSYAQTEPYFAQHSYVMNDVFQGLLDAAQFIESNKPVSSIKYLTNEGEQAFLQVQGSELKSRDLWVFVVDRPEDTQNLKMFRDLSQAMLQNGTSGYEIAEVYSTNSMRKMKDIMKKVKEEQKAFAEQQQQLEQAKLEQEQSAVQMQLQQNAEQAEIDRINDNYNMELDRINKKEIALIQAFGRNENAMADNDNTGIPDALEMTRLSMDQQSADKKFEIEMAKLGTERQKMENDKQKSIEDAKIARENMKNDKEIAQINAKNRAQKLASAKKKK